MSKIEPQMQKYMTTAPYTIEASKSVYEAEKMMLDYKIRHLPVMKDGQLFGILSDRDIKVAMGFFDSDSKLIKVGDICKEKPFVVEPDAKMHEVLDEMASQHYGSAVVVQNHKLVGIFTTVDACRAFSQVLQQRFHEGH